MVLVHNIGTENHSNYHTREQILASTQPLGFDGIYKNVYDNQDVLAGKSGIFFVMGNYIGGDNAFDIAHVPKLEQYCTMEQIQEMCTKYDFEIGWHTWSHPDLTKLTAEEVMREITPPTPMRYFAYPYGKFNQMVIDCVKRAGYQKAWSVTQGSQNPNDPDYDYKIYRPYL
jgi:peptidoglycan/xylan/chitin deacetylase (PgdA/CDA1 family)